MGEILIRALGFIAIIALGYFLKLKRIVKREDAKVLSAIVMNVTLPAALLTSASEVQLDSGMLIPLVLGFAMGAWFCYEFSHGLGWLLGGTKSRDNSQECWYGTDFRLQYRYLYSPLCSGFFSCSLSGPCYPF